MASPLSKSREQLLDRFVSAWNDPAPPCIEDFVPPADSPAHFPMLVELVKIDMERRVKGGERVRLEEMYLPRFPELDAVPSILVDLLIREFELRRHEPGLSCREYQER